jgi:hypothetical protein
MEYQALQELSKPLLDSALHCQAFPGVMRRSAMTVPVDLTSLSHEELLALVLQLRQQLAEREQEISRLERLTAPAISADTSVLAPAEPEPGSPDDLLAQLEKIYPDGK